MFVATTLIQKYPVHGLGVKFSVELTQMCQWRDRPGWLKMAISEDNLQKQCLAVMTKLVQQLTQPD